MLLGFALLALLVFPFLSMVSALPSSEHAALFSRDTLGAMWTTIVAAGVAILADAALGIPLAYWMARSRSRLRHLAVVAVLLPLAVPPVVGGLELVLWLGPYGWLGKLLDHVGLNPLDTIRGTILAQMFIAAPFVIVSARAAFSAVEPAVTDAARSLGCGPWRTLVRVTLPAARRGIAAGLVLGWLRAIGEFGASIIVAYHPFTLSNLAFVQLSGRGLRTALPTGALLAAIGVVTALALVALDVEGRRRPSASAQIPQVAPRAIAYTMAPAAAPGSQGEPAPSTLDVRVKGKVGGFTLDVALEATDRAVAILGSSGAGKSLTIRTVAGLLKPASGRVALARRVLLDSAAGLDVPAERRGLGYVSQDSALFPHLDVEDNVAFGLRGLPRPERAARVEELLETFGLTALRHARPRTLSGGERQQVALARALAPRPTALLLDEPFSSLDAGLRRTLREIVRQIHDATGIPFVLVTHDRDDALDLADYVVVMDGGRILQQGRIEEVFARPVNGTVAHLVGIPNVVPVTDFLPAGQGRVCAITAWGAVDTAAPLPGDSGAGSGWELAVPPDAVALRFDAPDGAVGLGFGVVASVRPGATSWRVVVRAEEGGDALVATAARSDGRPEVGAQCAVAFDVERCHLMATVPAADATQAATLVGVRS
jgi:molybdate transport system permease protein